VGKCIERGFIASAIFLDSVSLVTKRDSKSERFIRHLFVKTAGLGLLPLKVPSSAKLGCVDSVWRELMRTSRKKRMQKLERKYEKEKNIFKREKIMKKYARLEEEEENK